MDVRLLGPVEASVDGRPVAIGAGKPRALLALLALRAGSTVSSDRLIDGLWGDAPPATATKLVQLHVSQLRKALAGDGEQIVTRGHGYELRARPRRRRRPALRAARGERAGRARRSPCGAGRRSTTSPASRSPPPRSAGSRSCGSAALEQRDRRTTSPPAVTARSSASSSGSCSRSRCASACTRSGCSRCTARGRQADALEAYRHARARLVERDRRRARARSCARLHEAILRQDPRSRRRR